MPTAGGRPQWVSHPLNHPVILFQNNLWHMRAGITVYLVEPNGICETSTILPYTLKHTLIIQNSVFFMETNTEQALFTQNIILLYVCMAFLMSDDL